MADGTNNGNLPMDSAALAGGEAQYWAEPIDVSAWQYMFLQSTSPADRGSSVAVKSQTCATPAADAPAWVDVGVASLESLAYGR